MTVVLVDSNVLLDLLTTDMVWYQRSATAIAEAADRGRVVLNPIIYAEVSTFFPSIENLDDVLSEVVIEREDIPYSAAFLAGKAFLAYRRRGGTKQSPLSDFFIGAHALVAGYDLMTRDTARFRTYFPDVHLIVS